MIIDNFELRPHDVLGGRYRIVGTLGEGGMGTVYLAEDLKLTGRRWAVKQTRRDGRHGAPAPDEAAMLLKLSHPYLPHVVDYFPQDASGCSYLVMEYIEGDTLQRIFERNGRAMDAETVIRHSIELCDLLDYLHALAPTPVVYRDIKPANMMVDRQGHIRLIDFGIARVYKAEQAADTVPLGTIPFAAPELLESGRSDHRSDLYSLGATMYYLLSGGDHYCVKRLPLAKLGLAIPRMLAETVDRLLEPNPDHRPQSASEVRKRLEACRDELDSSLTSRRTFGSDSSFRVVPRRRIVVGGLYPGAGATFIAIALARALHARGIPHAVVEHPAARPELYGLLFGERDAPPGYVFYTDRMGATGTGCETDGPRRDMRDRAEANTRKPKRSRAEVKWKDGFTEWYPVGPDRHAGFRDAASLELALRPIDAPVLLVDIGDRWLDDDVRDFCDAADEFVVVADPFPSRWSSLSSRDRVRELMRRCEAGKPVRFVANKAADFPGRSQWLASFPQKPAATVPLLPFDQVLHAAWKGKLVQDAPHVRERLAESLEPLLQRLADGGLPLRGRGKKMGIVRKFFSARY